MGEPTAAPTPVPTVQCTIPGTGTHQTTCGHNGARCTDDCPTAPEGARCTDDCPSTDCNDLFKCRDGDECGDCGGGEEGRFVMNPSAQTEIWYVCKKQGGPSPQRYKAT